MEDIRLIIDDGESRIVYSQLEVDTTERMHLAIRDLCQGGWRVEKRNDLDNPRYTLLRRGMRTAVLYVEAR